MNAVSPAASVGAVILAAGKGTRMHSNIPKVLQRILEEPMLRYVYDAVRALQLERVWTVIGHAAESVRLAFPEHRPDFVPQAEQLGTGHALRAAWPAIQAARISRVLVINGDTPLLQDDTLRRFLDETDRSGADIAFLSLTLSDPGTFGRVTRGPGGQVRAVIEAKDYDPVRHGPEPREINAGIYCLKTKALAALLPLLSNVNRSGEYYITDLIGLGVDRGLTVQGCDMGDDADLLGVNTPLELAAAEERMRARLVERHVRAGAIIRAPQSVRIGPDVSIAPGVDITGPCELYGATRLAPGARIASHCRLHNVTLEADVTVHSFCHLEDAVVGSRAIVGPYARLRPGTILEAEAHVGNFVETKKARLGKGAKANHLSYLGDADIGAGANVGAGTITCNYDGKNKHRTEIGAHAFIGSNTALVAPVRVGDAALVGAGSVITKDVPDGRLGLGRARQVLLPLKHSNESS